MQALDFLQLLNTNMFNGTLKIRFLLIVEMFKNLHCPIGLNNSDN